MIDQANCTFEIVGTTDAAVQAARELIETMVEEPEAGKTYRGCKVAGVEKFGLFVEFLPDQQGLVHVSELGGELPDFSVGDVMDVKLLEVRPIACGWIIERRNGSWVCAQSDSH